MIMFNIKHFLWKNRTKYMYFYTKTEATTYIHVICISNEYKVVI